MDENKLSPQMQSITKGSAYFILNNGPIKNLIANEKISSEEAKEIQEYLQNHLSYLYKVLLEENNIKKFELVVNTMNKFYVEDSTEIHVKDDGFDGIYKSLFQPKPSNISIK